jgi:hypothetical protein
MVEYRKMTNGWVAIADDIISKPQASRKLAKKQVLQMLKKANESEGARIFAGFSMMETADSHAETWDDSWSE